MHIPVLFLLCCVLLSTAGAQAQYPVFKADRLTVQNGLSDNMVFCALQDRRGVLWFGTRNGLNRYDGYRCTAFYHNRRTPYSLSDAPVHSLIEDRHGRLWVGTAEGGLNLFDPVTERFVHYRHDPRQPNSILPGVIMAMCEDTAGCLWIVLDNVNRGVQKFDPVRGVFTTYRYDRNNPYSLSSDMVRGVCRDSSGAVWVVTRMHGLNRYDPVRDGFVNHRTVPAYRFAVSPVLYRLFATRDGGLWLTDSISNVWKVYPRGDTLAGTRLALHSRAGTYDDMVTSVVEGVDSRVWVGTQGGGLAIIDRRTGVASRVTAEDADPHGIASNRICMLYADRNGDLWICTDMGVHRFHRHTNYLEHFGHNPSDAATLSHPRVRSLLYDSGRLLIGTGGGGLDISHRGVLRHCANSCAPGDIAANTLNSLYRTRDGTVWAGTNNGLFTVEPATGRFSRTPYALRAPRVWAICEDSGGMLWVGTLFNGLTRIDRRTGAVRHYLTDRWAQRSGTTVSVHVVYEDRRRTLWVGTNNGLYRLDRPADTLVWSAWASADSHALAHNHIWLIHEAHDGRLWLGTTGGGLNLFDPATGRCIRYDRERGLPSDIICGVEEDSRGDLWVSTNTGLFRFTPSTGTHVAYGAGDGLYIGEFHFRASCRDSSGALYFGGTGGYLRFHPDSMRLSRPYNLLITSFTVFNHRLVSDTAISLKRHIVLPHSSNFFSVEFVALDFAGAHHHRYRYRLDGYDHQWQYTDGTRPFAGYTDVPPGDYRFVVEALDDGTARSSLAAPTAIAISITPAWWQTLWFRGVVVLAVGGIVLGSLHSYLAGVRRRSATERRLVELQLESLRAQMNPHFIFNALNSIYYSIMSHDNSRAQRYLGVFAVLLRRILEYSRRPFISIGREIELLTMYLDLEAMRFSQRFDYRIVVAPDIDVERQMIPTMLLQPYAENAVRHGLLPKEDDCLLTIEFRRCGHRIECSITDNGIGRELAQRYREQSTLAHTSQGMALSQERLANLSELHGALYGVDVHDLTSETGEAVGTRIVLTFPAEIDGSAAQDAAATDTY